MNEICYMDNIAIPYTGPTPAMSQLFLPRGMSPCYNILNTPLSDNNIDVAGVGPVRTYICSEANLE